MTRLTDDHPGLVKPGRGNPSDNVDVAPATPHDGEAIPGGETRTLEFWRETGPKDRRGPDPRTWELAGEVCKVAFR